MHVVEAEEPERQRLTAVADDDAQAGEAVEDAAHDDPEQMQAGLDAKAIDRAVESGLDERRDHRLRRGIRVQVDRHAERLAGLEDRPELLVVQVLAVRVRVEYHALEAQPAHATLDLFRSARGVLRRRGGEPGVAVRMTRDGGRELVVGVARDRAGRGSIEHLDAGGGERQDLHVDAGFVHVPQPTFAQVLDPLDDGGGTRTLAPQIEPPEARKAGVVERPAREQLAIEVEQAAAGEGLFGRNAQIARRPSARDRLHLWRLGLAHRCHLARTLLGGIMSRPCGGESAPGVDYCFALGRVRNAAAAGPVFVACGSVRWLGGSS